MNSTYQNPNFKRQEQQEIQPQVRIPNYYNVPNSANQMSFMELLKENPAYDFLLKPFIEHPIITLGTWLGLGYGLDAYSHACGGKYEKSLVAKAANLGDKIQNSSAIQNKPVQTVLSGFGKVGNLGKKAVKNSAILRAVKDTPTMPEWGFVKSQMYNQKQEVVQDFVKIVESLGLTTKADIPLKNIGPSKRELEMLKKLYNTDKISSIPQREAVNHILLDRLGKTPEEIKKIQALGATSTQAVKAEILKEMGLDAEKYKLIKDDVFGEYLNDVKEATKRVKNKVKIGAGHYEKLGPLTKPFERTVSCDEVYNKLHSMTDGAKTGTGRFMSKAMQMLHRGITFGGGKLGALVFIAPMLVELGMNVSKAESDQKIGTAANQFVEKISWVLTFPLALVMLHSVGGIKHAGMSKDAVKQYRKLVEEFNDKVKTKIEKDGIKMPNPDTFKSKKEYDIARKEVEKKLKELRTVKGQNIFTKGVRKVAGILTPDLCKLNSYRNSNFAANTARKLPAFFRNCVGVPARLALWGWISMGVLDGALTKGTTAIFGKSHNFEKEDEQKAAKKEQKQFLHEDLNRRLYEAQRIKQFGVPQENNQQINSQQNIMSARGKNQFSNGIPQVKENIDNYSYIPSQDNVLPHPIRKNKVDNYTYIPSQENTIKSDKSSGNSSKRTYIPSQAAANIQKNFDNSGLQSALDRAQRAEERALRVLAGNFDGM